MHDFFGTHPKTQWFLITLAGLVLALILFSWLFNWNLLRPTVAGMISARTGRATSITGDLKVHLWSFEPRVEIDGLTLKNPSWARHAVMFRAQALSISISLGRLLRGQIVLPEIDVVQPTIDLERDAKGRASWQFGTSGGTAPKSTAPAKIPTIRRLLIENGKIDLDDAIRKLKLNGTLVAADEAGRAKTSAAGAAAFRLRCTGSLNAKPFSLELNGGPLVNLEPDHPYRIEGHVKASDIALNAQVEFPKPFDLSAYQVKFDVSGGDLADVYYLTGLALPNTPAYRLAADMRHVGSTFRMDNLQGRLGSSDLEGEVQIDIGGARPRLRAKLKSSTLNIADLAPTLGHPAAAANSPSATPAAAHPDQAAAAGPAAAADSGRLFPDADLQVDRVRGMDADVTYAARSVTAPKVPMKEVNFHLMLDDGVLTMQPLSFVLDSGTFSGNVRLDARQDVPESSIDMRIENVDLGQFKSAKARQPPMQGTLLGHVKIHGRGASIRKLLAGADGGIGVVIPEGQISEALAELTGINVLNGLGVLISASDKDTTVRCGVAAFQAQQGVLGARTVFIDTSKVLITGRGTINLATEHLDLSLQGDPKKLRLLRLRTPITVHGTLLHPIVGVNAEKLAAQTGVAVALGTLLTPVAAALALIDPGLAKNKDCAAVLAQTADDPLNAQ
jgi:uncharacterized protein involved in outer membrane biogenesis